MPDNLLLPFSGRAIVDSNGKPLSGAKLEVFDAGTATQKNVFTDAALTTAAANPIVTDSTGIVPLRYLGTGSWKVTFKDSADAVLSNYDTWDNVPGALDTSAYLTGSVSPSRASKSETTAATMTSSERGKQINADATGGDFTYTLEAATAGGDSTDIVVKNTGETGVVTVDRGAGADNHVLMPLDSATFRSDGATWHVVEAFNATAGSVTLTYASSVTPDLIYPTGTEYVITCTGDLTIENPTSVRPATLGFFRIVMDGTGNHTVTMGSNFSGNLHLDTSANGVSIIGWRATSTTNLEHYPVKGPTAETLSAVILYQPADTTAGQSATTGSFAKVTLDNAATYDDGRTLANLSSSVMELHPGTHRIKAWFCCNNTSFCIGQIYNTSDSARVGPLGLQTRASTVNETPHAFVDTGLFTLTSQKNLELQHQATAAGTLGSPASFGIDESYVRVEIYTR